MKIEKLYTLSQFVDELIKDGDSTDEGWMAAAFGYIAIYNDFLKQPLKKEMFVHNIRRPTDKEWIEEYDKANEINNYFLEAEKKLIFDQNMFDAYGMWRYEPCKTLYELAEATNGIIITKNIEL